MTTPRSPIPFSQQFNAWRAQRDADAQWRLDWTSAARDEAHRVQAAGFELTGLAVWHKPRFGTARNGVRMGASMLASIGLPTLGILLSPALLVTRGLPWFSKLATRLQQWGPSGSLLGVRTDPENPGFGRLTVGAESDLMLEVLAELGSSGLDERQAREAVIGHEIGHVIFASLTGRPGELSKMGDLIADEGIGRGLLDFASEKRGSALADQAVAGAPMGVWLAGSAIGEPVWGALGAGVAIMWSSREIKRLTQRKRPPLSAKIFEEGFCDAFAALLPLVGDSPDVELARGRALGFKELRGGQPMGAPHGVGVASDFVLGEIERGRLVKLSAREAVSLAARAAAKPVGLAWTMSSFDEWADVMIDRNALVQDRSSHEVADSPEAVRRSAAALNLIVRQRREDEIRESQAAEIRKPRGP